MEVKANNKVYVFLQIENDMNHFTSKCEINNQMCCIVENLQPAK